MDELNNISSKPTGMQGAITDEDFQISEFGIEAVASMVNKPMAILRTFPKDTYYIFDNLGNIMNKPNGVVMIPFQFWDILNKKEGYNFIDKELCVKVLDSKTNKYVWETVDMEYSLQRHSIWDIPITLHDLNETETNIIMKAFMFLITLAIDLVLFFPWLFCEVMKRIPLLYSKEIEQVQTNILESENWVIPVPMFYWDLRNEVDGIKRDNPRVYYSSVGLIDAIGSIVQSGISQKQASTGFQKAVIDEIIRVINKLRNDANLKDSDSLKSTDYLGIASDIITDYQYQNRIALKALVFPYFAPPGEARGVCESFAHLIEDLDKANTLQISKVKAETEKLKTNLNYFIPKFNWLDQDGIEYKIDNYGNVT